MGEAPSRNGPRPLAYTRALPGKTYKVSLVGRLASWWKRETEAEAQRRKDRAFEASWENLRKVFASPRYHKPRPLRGPEEQLMIRRFVLRWWINPDPNKPSGRKWARDLGIDHA